MDKLKKEYQDNPDFRKYVDRYAAGREIPVEEALKHRMVMLVLEYRSKAVSEKNN